MESTITLKQYCLCLTFLTAVLYPLICVFCSPDGILTSNLTMRTLHRLKLMSSPSLSDLGKSDRAALEERGAQQCRAGTNAIWNRYETHAYKHTHQQGVFETGITNADLYRVVQPVCTSLKLIMLLRFLLFLFNFYGGELTCTYPLT